MKAHFTFDLGPYYCPKCFREVYFSLKEAEEAEGHARYVCTRCKWVGSRKEVWDSPPSLPRVR